MQRRVLVVEDEPSIAETILYADIDLGEVVRGAYDFDVAGHYARPDVFQLTVDERKRAPVARVTD